MVAKIVSIAPQLSLGVYIPAKEVTVGDFPIEVVSELLLKHLIKLKTFNSDQLYYHLSKVLDVMRS